MTHPTHPRSTRARARGFSLVELTVAIVILGIIGILLVRWIGAESAERAHALQRDLLQRADDALLSYAAIHSRLPCPDADGNGREDCAGGQSVGTLPYATLGLPDARAARVRYGVLRRTGTLTLPEWDDVTSTRLVQADLATRADRAHALQKLLGGTVTEVAVNVRAYDTCTRLGEGASCDALPQLRDNALDLCDALRSASLLPVDAGFLHTRRDDRPAEIAGHVAYALAITDALAPAPEHTGASVAFHSPRRPSAGGTPTDTGYQDKVHAVGLDQLWTRLRCGETYGPAIHAHANVAVAASLNPPAMRDYQEQLAIMLDLAVANNESADAGLVAAAAQITSATAGVLDTIGETFETYGGWNWRVAVATAGIGTAVGGMIAAGVMKGYATTYENRARSLLEEFSNGTDYPRLSSALETAIAEDARRADMLGTFPDPEVRRVAEGFRLAGSGTP